MRIVFILVLFLVSASCHAHEWHSTHPFLDTKTFPQFNERYFREAYVDYRFEDSGNTIVIDLHDQFFREGSLSDYFRHKREGALVSVEVREVVLKRVFALFSQIRTEQQQVESPHHVYMTYTEFFPRWFEPVELKRSYGAWWMVDNFGWLDEILEEVSMQDIVASFTKLSPHVSKIKFSFEAPECRYQINSHSFAEGCNAWIAPFGKEGVTLVLD